MNFTEKYNACDYRTEMHRHKSPMAHITLLFSVLLLTLCPFKTGAADLAQNDQKIITGPGIADLITYSYGSNPSIKAARSAWKSEIERYKITTSYPDPQLMVTYFTDPIETRLGPQDWNATLSQMIPFPGKLSKAGEMVSSDAQIARLNLEIAIRDTIVDLRLSYHELLYLNTATQITAENSRLLDEIRKSAETGNVEGRTNLVDVMKAQSQVAQIRYDGLLLDELIEAEKTKINSLLSRPPEAAIGPLAPEPVRQVVYSLDEIYKLAEENQEEIKIAQQNIAKAEAGTDMAVYETLPEFRLGLFYAGIGEPDTATQPRDAGRDAVGVQAGLTIPLWFGKSASRVRQAKANLTKAQEMKNIRVNKTQASIRQTYFRLNNAQRLMDLYKNELLPQAVSAISTAETWYRNGQGSFSDFVETQSTLYNFQLAAARAQADYGKFLASLEGLCGRSLSTKSIDPKETP